MPHYPVSTKPRFGELITPNHPLAIGLIAAYTFGEGAGRALNDMIRGQWGTISPACVWRFSYPGLPIAMPVLDTSPVGATGVALPPLGLSGNHAFTVVTRCVWLATPNYESPWSFGDRSGSDPTLTVCRIDYWSATSLRLTFNNWNSTDELIATTTDRTNQVITLAATYDPLLNKRALYLNGIQVAIGTPAITPNFANYNYNLGYYINAGSRFPGEMDYTFFYNRALSAGEIAQLAVDPLVMWHPITRPVSAVKIVTSGARAFPFAASGFARAASTFPFEASVTILGAKDAFPFDTLRNARVTPMFPFAASGSARATPMFPFDTRAGVMGAKDAFPFDTLRSVVGAKDAFPLEALGGVGVKPLLPFEARGLMARAFAVLFPMDSRGGIGVKPLLSFEANGLKSRSLSTMFPFTSGGSLYGRVLMPLESSGRDPSTLLLIWNDTRLLSAPLPLRWSVVSQLLASSLALQWNITATLAALGLSWRVLPNIFTPFGINRNTGQWLGGTSGDVQKPVAIVTKTP